MDLVNLVKIAAVVVAALLIYLFAFVLPTYRALYRKVGPNEVLVVSGGKGEVITDPSGERRRLGFRLIKGGGTLVNPLTERVDVMSLELVPINMRLDGVASDGGALVDLELAGHIRLLSDPEGLRVAAECLLSKGPDQVGEVARQVIDRHVRRTVRASSREEIRNAPDVAADRVMAGAEPDLAGVGLELIGLGIRRIASGDSVLEAGSSQVGEHSIASS